jgi:hypothetical protein
MNGWEDLKMRNRLPAQESFGPESFRQPGWRHLADLGNDVAIQLSLHRVILVLTVHPIRSRSSKA